MSIDLGKNPFRLGFGLMRLPKLSDGKKIDIEQTSKMVDLFIESGGTYFDTAYVYDDGLSELAARDALVKRYPRDSFTLCTKLCAWQQCRDEKSAKQQFHTSLERTQAGYFDYYMLHALEADNYKKYDEYHIWDFVREQKEMGLVKRFGFSFHASPELLDEILTAHPDVDFIQLQINYADWNDPEIASGRNYEIARKHGKPIAIMEPVKGGALANPIPEVKKIFDEANGKVSYASWAIRYAASLEGVLAVLSGMSNVEQMRDNISFMKVFKPLDEKEREAIRRAQDALEGSVAIKCTGCNYCVGGCPKRIPIPEIFAACNENAADIGGETGRRLYGKAAKGKGKASDCVKCLQCERACPQHLPITGLLEKAAAMFGR